MWPLACGDGRVLGTCIVREEGRELAARVTATLFDDCALALAKIDLRRERRLGWLALDSLPERLTAVARFLD